VTAIAAIGMKSRLGELASVGNKLVLLMVGETVFLAGLVPVLMRWVPRPQGGAARRRARPAGGVCANGRRTFPWTGRGEMSNEVRLKLPLSL
jgi:hypothetical protein